MNDFVVISDYVVDINYRSINICTCIRFICVDGDAAVNMPNNNNNNEKHTLYLLLARQLLTF